MIHVLVVDDDPPLVRALVLNLTRRGYRVTSAELPARPRALARRANITEPDTPIRVGMGYRYRP